MVLMRHTKLTDQILAATKKRTIRKPRKKPIKVGETLHHYAFLKIGNSIVKSKKQIHLYDLSDKDAQLDGFIDATEAIDKLMRMHKKYKELEFNIIDYDPQWEPCIIITKKEVLEILNWWGESEGFTGYEVATKLEEFVSNTD